LIPHWISGKLIFLKALYSAYALIVVDADVGSLLAINTEKNPGSQQNTL